MTGPDDPYDQDDELRAVRGERDEFERMLDEALARVRELETELAVARDVVKAADSVAHGGRMMPLVDALAAYDSWVAARRRIPGTEGP